MASALLAICIAVNSRLAGSRAIEFGDCSLRVCLSLDIRPFALAYSKRIARKFTIKITDLHNGAKRIAVVSYILCLELAGCHAIGQRCLGLRYYLLAGCSIRCFFALDRAYALLLGCYVTFY